MLDLDILPAPAPARDTDIGIETHARLRFPATSSFAEQLADPPPSHWVSFARREAGYQLIEAAVAIRGAQPALWLASRLRIQIRRRLAKTLIVPDVPNKPELVASDGHYIWLETARYTGGRRDRRDRQIVMHVTAPNLGRSESLLRAFVDESLQREIPRTIKDRSTNWILHARVAAAQTRRVYCQIVITTPAIDRLTRRLPPRVLLSHFMLEDLLERSIPFDATGHNRSRTVIIDSGKDANPMKHDSSMSPEFQDGPIDSSDQDGLPISSEPAGRRLARLELDDQVAYEVAWAIISSRIAELTAQSHAIVSGTVEHTRRIARIREITSARDGLNPRDRDAIDLIIAQAWAVSDSADISHEE